VLQHFSEADVVPTVEKLAIGRARVDVLGARFGTARGFRLVVHGFPD
jgi:hypothetical protein